MPPINAKIELVQSVPYNAERVFGRLTVATAGTPVRMSSHGDFAPNNRIFGNMGVQADPSNASGSLIYVGFDATVSSTNFATALAPGESFTLPVANPDDVYLDASTNGLNIAFWAVR